jgi:hypothetical protein
MLDICFFALVMLIAATSIASATKLIAAGGYHACVIGADGSLRCIGSNE